MPREVAVIHLRTLKKSLHNITWHVAGFTKSITEKEVTYFS
jgi:hypothetical protein